MQDNIRPIAPISIAGLNAGMPATGMPIFEFVNPTDLFVDPAYQRNVSEKGLRQIRRIVQGFDWAKFKPPICAYAECDGKTILKVMDGQHTAIAAASNPHLTLIPVMIVTLKTRYPKQKRSSVKIRSGLGSLPCSFTRPR